jgi:hypothetical protein
MINETDPPPTLDDPFAYTQVIVEYPSSMNVSEKPRNIVNKLLSEEREKVLKFQKEIKQEIYVPYISDLLNAGEYCVAETNGSNLLQVLMQPGVDKFYTYSNEIKVVHKLFGIEAARNLFILEFRKTLNQGDSDKDDYTDPRHICIVADVMFNQGEPNPFTFRGFKRQKRNFLSLMTIEQALDVVSSAASMGRTETLESTSASIMVNKQALIGTGFTAAMNIITPEIDKEVENLISSEEVLDPDEVMATLEHMDAQSFGVESVSISNDYQMESIYDQIFSSNVPISSEIEPKNESVIIDKGMEPKRPVIMKTIDVVDPSLIKAKEKVRLPSVPTRSAEEFVLQEEHTPNRTNVKIVEPPSIIEYSDDLSGSSTTIIPEPKSFKQLKKKKTKKEILPSTSESFLDEDL